MAFEMLILKSFHKIKMTSDFYLNLIHPYITLYGESCRY